MPTYNKSQKTQEKHRKSRCQTPTYEYGKSNRQALHAI